MNTRQQEYGKRAASMLGGTIMVCGLVAMVVLSGVLLSERIAGIMMRRAGSWSH